MGFDPVSIGLMAVGMAGAAVSAEGTYEQGQAQGRNADYQSQVARNNAEIARQNVAMTQASGASKEAAQGMRTRASVGAIKAGQGASNIDVNSGSALDVREAAGKLGALDALTIRSNTAREAYGYEVASTSSEAESKLLTQEGEQARSAGETGALGTFLSGASSVGGRYASLQLGAPKAPAGV